jgi:vancomycin resistance protein YoaR
LKVVERDHHVWPATYVPVGRDAAVAYGIADLEIVNPYDQPVRIVATIRGDELTCALRSRTRPEYQYRIIQDRREVIPPTEVVISHVGNRVRDKRVIVGGKPGYRIRTYRLVLRNAEIVRKELLSDDYYKPLGRVVQVGW